MQDQTRKALERFLTCLVTQDVAGLEALLVADARAVSDGGGEFLAALKPVIGRDKILRFYLKTTERRGQGAHMDVRMFNGLPALMVEFTDQAPREATRMVMGCTVSPDGQITTLHSILASRKLTAVHFAFSG